MAAGQRRLWRNYLLDPKYQLRHVAFIVSISAALAVVLGLLWYRQVRETSTVVEVRALGQIGGAQARQLEEEMRHQDQKQLALLAGAGVVFVMLLAGYTISLTHKVAGPLFKMSRIMDDVREGKLTDVGGIRRGDHLHGFFDAFREMHEALRAQTEREVTLLGEVIASVEGYVARAPGSADPLNAPISALKELRQEKQRGLGGGSARSTLDPAGHGIDRPTSDGQVTRPDRPI